MPCLLQINLCYSDFYVTFILSDKEIVMAKKGIQENNFIFSKDRTDNFVAHKTDMTIIKCLCGFEILLVPDLTAMNRAIKIHVTQHKKANHSLERHSLEDFLTEQILIAATKMSVPNVSKSRKAFQGLPKTGKSSF